MKKIVSFLEEKVVPNVIKFTQTKVMRVLMDGFTGIAALTIAGSIFTLIKSLPLGDAYTNFLTTSGLMEILDFPIKVTTELIAIYLVFAIGYFWAKESNQTAVNGGFISLGAFLLLQDFSKMVELTNDAGVTITDTIEGVLSTDWLGAQGVFLALIVGFSASSIYVWLLEKDIKIKMPASVPPNVTNMFEAMIPTGVVFIIFMAIRVGLAATPFGNANILVFGLLQAPLTNVGGGLGGLTVFVFVISFLWLFGVHGSMIAYIGMSAIIMPLTTANATAFANNLPAPNPEWNLIPWILMGGAGCTLGLNILMAFAGKSEQMKTLGRVALPTSLFNINEPILFGTPVVLNPFLAIPFIVVPLVNLYLSYAVMIKFKWIAAPTGAAINNFLPFGVQGALTTASWTGLLWSLIILVVDIVLYFPFFKFLDNRLYKEEQGLEAEVK